MSGSQLFIWIGFLLGAALLLSIVAIILGSSRPNLVLPKFMHPTPRLVHLVYGTLILWLFLGSVGFLYLSSVS